MCGICGIVHFSDNAIDSSILERANNTMSSRGPDGCGIKIIDNVGLAHRRLSIIDIASGQQPLSNEDETIWITFNGEIYNYLTLKVELIKLGHIFRTNSDTEVIVHLYESFGKDCIRKLDGMFAFSIYDKTKNRLLLARDRLGKKPLVYSKCDDNFIFASELQALASFPSFNKELNPQTIHDFLSFTHIPAPLTIYKNAFKLQPGHYLELDIASEQINIGRYWKSDFSTKSDISFNDAKIELKRLLRNAAQKRLMSEVPLGCFVSGGLDSAVVTALMSECLKGDLSTFTIGFDDPQYDERHYAQTVADHFKTNHHVRKVTPSDFSVLEKIIKNFGEPFADASMIPTAQLAGFARENITVALSGDGGDEFFGGYYRYSVFRYAQALNIIPQKLRKTFADSITKILSKSGDERKFSGKVRRVLSLIKEDGVSRYFDMLNKTDESLKYTIYGDKLRSIPIINPSINYLKELSESLTSCDSIERLMELDIYSYLPNDILTKVDIASMSSSLEVRSPLLDYDVIDFLAKLPISFKNTLTTRKRLLIETFRDDLPKEIYARKKMGFGVPVGRWIRNEWKEKSRELLLGSEISKHGYFKSSEVEKIFKAHLDEKQDYSYLLFSLMVMELWYRKFINN
ncbi:MAG: asparagine synthase (glutamine-hydrolyzing) [Lentisphaerota bacterium]